MDLCAYKDGYYKYNGRTTHHDRLLVITDLPTTKQQKYNVCNSIISDGVHFTYVSVVLQRWFKILELTELVQYFQTFYKHTVSRNFKF